MLIKSKKQIQQIDPDKLRFCGGSKMICGDYDIFIVCCALFAGVQAIENLPLKKRSIFHNHMLVEWKRMLEEESDWMQRLEEFQKGEVANNAGTD